jgi:hypothetical protein
MVISFRLAVSDVLIQSSSKRVLITRSVTATPRLRTQIVLWANMILSLRVLRLTIF